MGEAFNEFLLELKNRLNPDRMISPPPTNPGQGNKLAPTSAPAIKSRLEALLTGAGQLNSRLDALSHTISGDGAPPTTSGEAAAQPYAIPDQLSVLEDLLRRALDRTTSIFDRF